MKKAKYTAVLLVVTTVFFLFIGNVYAGDNTSTHIDSTTLVVKDGKVVSGDKSLVDNGFVVIGDSDGNATEEEDTVQSGKQPVKDNSALLGPNTGTGNADSGAGVVLPGETVKYVTSTTTFSTAGALRASGSYNVTSSWGPSTYQLMVVHLSRYMNTANTTYTMDTAIIARGYAILDGKISTIGTYNANKFTGPIFHVNNGTLNVTNDGSVSHIYNNNSGNVTIEGLRVCYQNYSSSETTMAGYVSGAGRWSNSNAFPDNYISWDSPAQFVSPLVVVSGGTANIYDSGRVYMQNNITNQNGSAAQASGGTLNLTNTTIRHCKTTGSGGAIYVGANGKAVLNNVTIDNCHASGNGGGIYVASGGQLTMNTVTISNCTANNGAAIYIAGSGTITFNTVTLNNNTAGASGGAIYVAGGTHSASATIKSNKAQWGGGVYVAGGTFTYSGGTMQSNSATVDGGGICCYGGTANVTGGTIRDNSAPQGGGLYVKGPGTIKMSGGTVTSNDNGSGVFLYAAAKFELSGSAEISSNTVGSHPGGGVAIYGNTNGSFKMSGGTIKSHSGSSAYHGIAQTNGGGTIEISGGTITDNHSPGGVGGGVYLEVGTFRMTNGTISNNTAKWGGGVLAKTGATSVTFSGGTISGNTAEVNGGGLMVESGTLTISGGTISGNTAQGVSTGDGNTGRGGGVVTIVNTTISGNPIIKGNTAKENGGGVYILGGTTTISGGQIGAQNESNYATNGGGLYIGDNTTITISGTASFCYNRCKTSGGGVFVHGSNTSFTMTGGNVSHNYNEEGNGGGFWVGLLKSCSITGGTVNHNTTYIGCGGGMFFNRPITGGANVSGLHLEENTANHAGGGLYFGNYGGNLTATVTNVTLKNNHAIAAKTASIPTAGSGGGIAVRAEPVSGENAKGNVTLTITNCTINGNTANEFGGGVYVVGQSSAGYKPTVTINGTTKIGESDATANTANSGGGGVYVMNYGGANENIVFKIEGSVSIKHNTSASSGGGVFLNNVTGAIINNAVIAKNKVTNTAANGGNGGGIGLYNASLSMNGTTVSGNSTGYNGGGVVANTSSLTTTNCIFGDSTNGGNSCGNSGGGIYASGAATVSITGGSISHNTSEGGNGGGICLENITTEATISGTTFHLNTALFETPDMTLNDNTQKYNLVTHSSTGNGGAIYVRGETSVVDIIGAQIGNAVENGYSNRAINGGGIAVKEGANVTVKNSTNIVYNSALRNGGGVYVLGYGGGESADTNFTTTLTLTGGKVENNYARGYTGYDDSDNPLYNDILDAFSEFQAEMGGGGIYIRGRSPWGNKKLTISIDGTEINYNRSPRGAGIHIHESVNITVSNASFTENSASLLGGAMCFLKNSSTAKFTNCTFTENKATLRGGALYIQTNGVTVEGCTFTENTATNNGGAIQLQSATNTNIDLKVSDTDFVGNSANYGGAICTVQTNNSNAFTVTLTNCDFTDNRATANGGAILVGNKVTLNMTGGYLTGNTAGADESGIEPAANNQNVGIAGVSGAGGAVAVFDGTFNYSVNATTNKGAIHSNTATTVGDDIFSNGSANAKLSIPAVSAMDLTGYTYEADKTPDWFEDYAEGEASGMNPNISSSQRYRFSDNTILANINNINTQGKYVAITIGVSVNLGELVITKSGDDIDPNQVFVFEISGVSDRSGDTIKLTVSIRGAGSVKIVDLPVGDYTVREITSWSWRYGVTTIEVDGEAVQYTNAGVGIKVEPDHIDHSVEFVNSLQNNMWLSHEATPIKNIPTQNTVVYNAMVFDLPKKRTV